MTCSCCGAKNKASEIGITDSDKFLCPTCFEAYLDGREVLVNVEKVILKKDKIIDKLIEKLERMTCNSCKELTPDDAAYCMKAAKPKQFSCLSRERLEYDLKHILGAEK